MRDVALWQRLGGHRIVLSDGQSLAGALAAGTGMRPSRAEAVVREYQRFLYIAAASSRPLAPSGLVDTAWHLHIADPASYDDVLCRRVIGHRIAHVAGGPGPRDNPAYAETFRVYREEFGQRPPWRIWPSRREEWRANLAMATVVVATGVAVAAFRGGHEWIGLWAGIAASFAGLTYAVIAPYAAVSRISKDGGCIAGAGEGEDPAGSALAKDGQ